MSSSGALDRLRAANRRTLAALLAGRGPMSRADLARASGLSRTTVSSLVTELLGAGHVVETPGRGRPHKGGSGRPPVLLALAAPAGAVAAVDIGHRHVRVAVADGRGSVLAEEHRDLDVDAHGSAALDLAAVLVRAATASAGLVAGAVHGVGMCVPAPLDRRSAHLSPGILPGWRDLVPADELHERLGLPVVADNDANLGALAELRHGAARGCADVVYVKVASGVGAGIVVGGRLHRGATGIAGELGHVRGDHDGPVCRCGHRGCLETAVAAPRLVERLQASYDEPLTVARLLELDADGEPAVRRLLHDAGEAVGRALADLCNSLNPEAVVLGGSLGTATSLVEGLRSALDRYAQPDIAAAVSVRPGRLGDRAELVGAVTLAVGRLALAEGLPPGLRC